MADEGLTFRFVFQDDSGGASTSAPSSGPSPSTSPAAPPDAAPGAAARAHPSPPPAAAPQPRRPPPDTSPARPASQGVGNGSSSPPPDESPSPTDADQPHRRRRRTAAGPADQTGDRENPREPASVPDPTGQRRPRPPRPPAAADRHEKPGEAAKLLGELVRHLQQIPGIGRAIGGLYNVVSPLIDGFGRIQKVRRDEAEKRKREDSERAARKTQQQEPAPPTPAPRQPPLAESAAPIPVALPVAQAVPKPGQPPAPRPPLPPLENGAAIPRAITIMPAGEKPPVARPPIEPLAETASSYRPTDRPNPDDQFPVKQFRRPGDADESREKRPLPEPPSGFNVAGKPDATAAMQKLIAALGPLPEDSKKLRQGLEPLTALGYTLAELVSAVRTMRHADEEQAPGVEGARPAGAGGEPPEPPDTAAGVNQPPPRSPRQPRAPTQPPPPPNGRTVVPTPGAPPIATQPAPRQPQPDDAGAPPPPSPGGATQAAGGLATAGAFMLGPEAGIAAIAVVAVVGAATRAFSGLINAVRSTDRLFTDLSHRLAPYNPKLAAAEANSQIKELLGNINQSRAMGGELADFTRERSKLDRNMQRIVTILEKFALNAAILPLLHTLNDGVEVLTTSAEWFQEFATQFSTTWDIAQSATLATQKAMAAHLKRLTDKDDDLDPLADILGIFGGHPGNLQIGGANFGNVNQPVMPAPIVPGPGQPPGMGIGF